MAWQLFWLEKMYKIGDICSSDATEDCSLLQVALFHQNPSEC